MTINTNYSVATGSVATAKAKFNKAKQEYDEQGKIIREDFLIWKLISCTLQLIKL